MAKTIPNLTALNETPADSDLLIIDDSGITRKVTAGNLKGDCIRTISDVIAIPDADNISLGTTTGSKIGTVGGPIGQKLGFFGATPVVQQPVATDLLDSLQNLGLIVSGAGNTPLNLSSGALTCGAATVASVTVSGNAALEGAISISNGQNISFTTDTGTKIGTGADQKIGFWNATPVAQPQDTGDTTTATTGSGDNVKPNTTFTGNTGNRAYTIGDIVRALKTVGILRTNNP